MSASTEKKLRQAAREAGTDKKLLAAQAEAKLKAKRQRRWTIGTIAVVLFVALVLFLNSSFLYTHTKAITVGDESYTPAQMNYQYSNQYYTWANQYGSYASLFGLDTSAGVAGLGSQTCPMLESGTWRDYFLQAASQERLQTKALLDYAADNAIELTEEEIAEVDASFEGMDEYVKAQGYASVDRFFAANYGRGVTAQIAREAGLEAALANKVLLQISDSFEYSASQLEEYYQSLNGDSDVFDYAYYLVSAETETVTAEDGTTSEAVNDETMAAAKATAEAILAAYENNDTSAAPAADDADAADLHEAAEPAPQDEDSHADTDAEAAADKLDTAVASQVTDASASRSSNVSGSSLSSAYKDWMLEAHSTGDATVVENPNSGYYVLVYLNRNDNHYKLAQVRHILVRAEADAEGNYSDEALAAALAEAQDIYKQWQEGEMTEDSFAALAQEYSEDAGSNTNGGLYDAVAQGQMVEEFDAFCFEGHEYGDTAIVFGQSSGYAGYHIMFYVGEGELYSDYIADNALRSQALDQWMNDLIATYESVTGFGYRLVG